MMQKCRRELENQGNQGERRETEEERGKAQKRFNCDATCKREGDLTMMLKCKREGENQGNQGDRRETEEERGKAQKREE